MGRGLEEIIWCSYNQLLLYISKFTLNKYYYLRQLFTLRTQEVNIREDTG